MRDALISSRGSQLVFSFISQIDFWPQRSTLHLRRWFTHHAADTLSLPPAASSNTEGKSIQIPFDLHGLDNNNITVDAQQMNASSILYTPK